MIIKTTHIVLATLLLTACGVDNEEVKKYLQPDKGYGQADDSSRLKALYAVRPDIRYCNEGALHNAEKVKVLNQVNEIRALHGLNPVTYNYNDDIYTVKSALISAANAKLEHKPSKEMHCWTAEGEKGSKTSNLHIDYYSTASKLSNSEDHIISFLIDDNVESLGHRRWILDPFLSQISYGRVDGQPLAKSKWKYTTGASLKVINEQKAALTANAPDFVAYPYHSYPKKWFKKDWYQSFSVLADKNNSWNNKIVDFSQAKITVTNEAGKTIPATSIKSTNDTFGLPNSLQWKVVDTQENQRYQVKIEHVKINGQEKEYQYWYEIK